MHRRWVLREPNTEARERISRASGVSGLVAAVLAARGLVEPEAVDRFLNPSLASLPDPFLIPGMDAAVERLAVAADRGETVWIYTDYDVDGVTSAALLREFLEASGFSVRVRLPRRDREGYGLNVDALREIAGQGGSLVVTADCGTTAVEPARVARDLGIDLVVTDHHTPDSEIPSAAAVVNPKLPGNRYPDAALAGVGVAWNLVAGVRRRLRERGRYGGGGGPDLRELLDLVALGTVADVVPLQGANRALVRAGLARMNRFPRPGIDALRAVAGLRGDLRAGHIGFQLGPRLNAAGRLEGPEAALSVLSTREPAEAAALARSLNSLNQRRQAEERVILEESLARVGTEGWWPSRWSLVLDSEGWNPGVIGIVASRLVERYHRPTVVLSREGGSAKGSARSIPGLHLFETLGECRDLLEHFGGHAAAAGVRIRADRVGSFRERFEEVVKARLQAQDLVPRLHLDAELDFEELRLEAVSELSCLEPFGVGNPTPVFLARDVRVEEARSLGEGGEHAKFVLAQGGRLEAVAWRKAEGLREMRPGDRVDVAFTPQVRSWNGREQVQLVVEGMRRADGFRGGPGGDRCPEGPDVRGA